MGRFRPQFTIGRLMIVVAIAATCCWLATDGTVGPTVLAFLVGGIGLALVHVVAVVALSALCGVLTWLGNLFPVRDDPPPRPAVHPSTDRNSP